jgi:DNA gyrase/topoisomerase IV subunit A
VLREHGADVLAEGLPRADRRRTSPGRAIANVLSLAEGEKIASIVPVREFVDGAHLLMATRWGR